MSNTGKSRRHERRSGPNLNRGPRSRPNPDKSLMNEGVYTNIRLTHTATSLIGCVVQVHLKNGRIFEGIFKTFSPKMEIVLEMAHKLEDSNSNLVPSKDRLIDTVIFHLKDIVTLSSQNVDLDYATKDSFTDSAISSKVNGPVPEKELQPWEGDPAAESLDTLDSGNTEAANGWDPNEMFKTNAEQYGVVSSYDPSLSQYTTPLVQENTKEFKEREARAARLANEIEKSESYKARIALENGDGADEEDKFSAVIRPNESNSPSNSGKYVPPHLRRAPQQGRAVRSQVSPVSQSQTPPARPPPAPASHNPSQPPADGPKINGEKEEKESLVDQSSSRENSIEPPEVRASSHDKELSPGSKIGHRKSNAKSRDEEIKILKEFSHTFKLSEPDEKEKENLVSNPQGPPPATSPTSQPAPLSPQPQLSQPDMRSEELQEELKQRPDAEKLSAEAGKKSTFTLNPNAKPFTPKHGHPVQAPTPPRPATQSPVIVQPMCGPPTPIHNHGQPMYPTHLHMVPVSMTPTAGVQNPPQQRFPPKRVVVSVQHRQDYNNPAAQAAAATGQPLLAQPNLQGHSQAYMQYVAQPVMGPGGASMPQMVQMTGQPRMMAPPAMMQAHQAPDHNSGMQQQVQQGTPQTVFVSPPGAGAVPAHIGAPHPGGAQPHPHVHPAPAHIAPHHQATPPHSQPSHMNSQSGSGHPAPSPVQHAPQGVAHAPGPPHPPSSGTPQPHIIFQPSAQMSQPGHPPLQPSPHTPTSPQSMHPPQMTYAGPYYTTQTGPQGMPQMSHAHSQPHTTVTHAQHQQHTHPPQPQIVMMPQHQHQHQHQHHAHAVNHGQAPQMIHGGPPAQLQHPHHNQGPPMQGRAPMHGQAGPPMVPQTINVTAGANIPHHQMQYMHHPQMTQTHPPPMQAYQHNQ